MRARTAAWLAAAWLAVGCGDPSTHEPATRLGEGAKQSHIVVIVLDTVRADHLATYGYERPTSDHLDALRAESRLYTRAYSTSGWTAPSHASLFTGLYSAAHGTTQENWSLSLELVTLSERLSAVGYQTVGVTGNAMLTEQRGFGQGFEIYEESWRGVPKKARDRATLRWLEDFLSEQGSRDDTRPLFLFVNLIGAHGPYNSCGESCGAFGAELDGQINDTQWRDYYRGIKTYTPGELDRLERLYDAEIREVDAHLGRILAMLETRVPSEQTLLVVASDHGENLGDHDHVNHVFSLHESLIRIPLLVRLPAHLPEAADAAGSVDDRPVQLVDLYPTLLGVAELPIEGPDANGPVHGFDLLSPDAPRRPVFSEYYKPIQALRKMLASAPPDQKERLSRHLRLLRSVESEGWKLVWASDGRHELYHLAEDPAERSDRIDDPNAATQRDRLLAQLEVLVAEYERESDASGESAEIPPLDDEARAALEAMGYLEDGGDGETH